MARGLFDALMQQRMARPKAPMPQEFRMQRSGGILDRAGRMASGLGSALNRGLDAAAHNPFLAALGGNEGILANHRNRLQMEQDRQTLLDQQSFENRMREAETEAARKFREESLALDREQFELDRSRGRDEKSFEAYVGGRLRQLKPQGAGVFVDAITGQAIDPATISFDEPVDPKSTLESMSPEGRTRVLFSGPNAIEASRTMTKQFGEGYSPNQDWGAAALRDAPIPGGDALARIAGGPDYQQSEQSWKQFEAGMLPILSGAAVTESEAKRVLNAMKPSVGDGPDVIARKVAAINRMSAIAEQAIGGQPVTDLSAIVELQPFLAQARSTPAAGQTRRRYNPNTGEIE